MVQAEIIAIREKAQRYIDGESSAVEVAASSPMRVAIAGEIGFLPPDLVVNFRRAVTLDMEMRKPATKREARMAKAQMTVEACGSALSRLSGEPHD